MRPFRSQSDRRVRVGAAIILVLAAFVLGPAPAAASDEEGGFPSLAELRRGYRTSDRAVLDRRGHVIGEVRDDATVRRLDWTELDAVSPAMQKAVVAAEDRHFWTHSGVDWLALGKSAAEQLARRAGIHDSGGIRGASTISMQVASLIREGLWRRPWRSGRRDWSAKWNQISMARQLEASWSKREILEAYLNLVQFRGELQGVASTSWSLFGKAPSGLTFDESVVLAALIRAPAAGGADVLRRACALGAAIDPEWQCRIAGLPRARTPIPKLANLAPHLSRRALSDAPGKGDVVTTLDRGVQAEVVSVLRKQVASLRSRNVHDAAAIVLDHRTGEILAYAGGIGEGATSPHVDGVLAHRQAGSTLKPLLYELAIERRLLTAGSLIDDLPVEFPVSGGVYRPRNFDNVFHGRGVPLRVALASSLNVPAVKALDLVGVESFADRLLALGFEQAARTGRYGPSLALGAIDVSLWELAQAYQTLANGGVRIPLHWNPSAPVQKSGRILPAAPSFIVSQILADREARALAFGLSPVTNTRFWTAVKTGTSKDMRDNWCVGSSGRYTVAVWVGNSSGEPMWDVSGITGAAPAWAEILGYLHRSTPSREPVAPAGVVRFESTWYLRGTEHVAESAPAWVKILAPTEGEWMARDPDIPGAFQKIPLRASGDSERLSTLEWRMDDASLGAVGEASTVSIPERGPHQLKLVETGTGAVVDEVRFVVR